MLWILLFSTIVSYANCNNLRIRDLDDIQFGSNPAPSEAFAVRRAGNGGCNFFLTLDNGQGSSYTDRNLRNGSNLLPVQIFSDSSLQNIIKNLPEVSSPSDVLVGSFPDGTTSPREIGLFLYPRLTNVDYQRFGDYEDEFVLKLYQGTYNGTYTLEDTDSIRLRYRVEKKIDLSIVNTGAPFDLSSTTKTLNFGTLTAGEQLGFDLVIKFNAGYRVRISSENNGNLKRAGFSNLISYSLQMNGNPVSLVGSASNPVLVAQGNGVSGGAGLRFGGLVTIGAVAGAVPGNYLDTITVTVSTTE